MRTSLSHVLLLTCATIFASVLVVTILTSSPRRATSANSLPLTGYAWSDNIGWISVNGAGYGLSMDTSGFVTGYAWSDNIGWVKFGGLASFPSGSGTTASNAQITAGRLRGWARACAGTVNGDCSSMVSRTDGWDGWIALSGTNYGVWYNATTTGTFVGFAWGDVNVGAVDFSRVQTAVSCTTMQNDNYCVGTSLYQHDVQGNACLIQVCTYQCGGVPAVCISPPAAAGTLTALPTIIAQGKTVTVAWNMSNVKNNPVNACTVTGTNGDSWTSVADGSGNSIASFTSGAINKQTVYTLTCRGVDDTDKILTATVNVIPKFREI